MRRACIFSDAAVQGQTVPIRPWEGRRDKGAEPHGSEQSLVVHRASMLCDTGLPETPGDFAPGSAGTRTTRVQVLVSNPIPKKN